MSLTFGQKLAQRRQWMGWSMAQAAYHLDVKVETYRTWESERHTPHRMVQVGCMSLLEQAAIEHASMILATLSTDNSHRYCSICAQPDRGPIDANTSSSGGS